MRRRSATASLASKSWLEPRALRAASATIVVVPPLHAASPPTRITAHHTVSHYLVCGIRLSHLDLDLLERSCSRCYTASLANWGAFACGVAFLQWWEQ